MSAVNFRSEISSDGFAPFTGGPLSYIDTAGPAALVETCKAYADVLGQRYEPPALVLGMAVTGDDFYHRFPPAPAAA